MTYDLSQLTALSITRDDAAALRRISSPHSCSNHRRRMAGEQANAYSRGVAVYR